MRSPQQISSAERALRKQVIGETNDPAAAHIAYAMEQALKWARGADLSTNMPEFAYRQADAMWRNLRRGRV